MFYAVIARFWGNKIKKFFFHVPLPLSAFDSADKLHHSVGYAANIGKDVSTFSYVYDGITGGFEGEFSINPYYINIQEYSNIESRDLWEYHLNISSEKISSFL